MKNRLFMLITFLSLVTGMALARTITGTVLDGSADNEPIIGATVSIKGTSTATATDVDGRFSINVPNGAKILIVNYVGMKPQEFQISKIRENELTVTMLSDNQLEEVVVTGMGARKKITLTGAVTNVNVEDMKHTNSSNLSNALAGNVPGIIAMQTSGQPGKKGTSEFWIRGISTFGAGDKAYILVDGFERDNIDDINIEDIQSFTVLKDASATAIYGSKGANGVVLITTKHGQEGKIKINAKVETSYNTRTKTPSFVDGVTYAKLLNEANITRSKGTYFTPTEIELFGNGLDPDIYPNVNWKDLILKDGAMSYRANLNISGGGRAARYFASVSYVEDEGMYKTDSNLKNRYNTNANYHRFNYRVNLDIDVTPTTLLRIGTSGDLHLENGPGTIDPTNPSASDNNVWNSLFGYNAILTPTLYSNGYSPMVNIGRNDYRLNPWVMATQTGYTQNWNNNLQNNASLEQDLKFITEGLKFTGRIGYDTYNSNTIYHVQRPELWYANGRDKATGEVIYDRIKDKIDMYQYPVSSGSRRTFVDLLLSWNREFKHGNNVGANLKYTFDSQTSTDKITADVKTGIARKNMALAGQVTYNYDYRYFVDFNFGYNGSEQFADGHRFGFFPAFSLAWNVAAEPWMKKFTWLNMFKIRYSWGKVGNDKMGNDVRFPYIYTIDSTGDNVYNFGNLIASRPEYQTGWHYSSLASNNVTWEVAKKQDVGFDLYLFNSKFSLTMDYFYERRSGIYMLRRYLPGIIGLESEPWANVGVMSSEGFDGNFAFNEKFGNVGVTVRGNITYARNTILDHDVENYTYPYQYETGYRYQQQRGLIAEGLFADYDDIRNSPKQMFGDVQPGDIKYKDVNGDGIVDNNDQVAIGATATPSLIYGFGASVQWKNFDVNLHFQGSGKSTVMLSGKTVWAFSEDRYGQILSDLVDGRYVDAETAAQLGIPANENPNASYPRLVHLEGGATHNNYRPSSFWMRDCSYLRLKNLELGYNLPQSILNTLHLEQFRIYLQGTNLLTFSNFKLWDPEMGSSNGEAYPLPKTVTLGLQVNF